MKTTIIIAAIIILLLVVFFTIIPIGMWISAVASGVKISIFTLVGMKLRRVKLSDGTLWEGVTADYFQQFPIPDRAV